MPDFGTPVAGRNTVDPNQGMQQLSGMMSLQRNMQAYQQSNEMFPQQLKEATANANVADQTQGSKIDQAGAQARNAGSIADSSQMALMKQKQDGIVSRYAGAINNPDIVNAEKNPGNADSNKLQAFVQSWGQDQAKNLGIPADQATSLIQPYMDMAKNNPGALRGYMKERLVAGLDHSAQASTLNPSGVSVSNGQQSSVTSTNEFGAQQPGQTIPGTAQQQQVPPTAQVTNEQTGQTSLHGPQLAQSAGTPGPATSMAPMDANALGQWGKHWNDTVAAATAAPGRVNLLTSARDNAVSAITGSAEKGLNWLTNIGSAVNYQPSVEAKDSFDLYKKELSQYLGSKGQGGTDLAQGIAGAGTPGEHMNKDALTKGFNELIAQEKMPLAQQQFFSGSGNDPQAYGKKFGDWSKINDYRAMGWNDMSPADKQKIVGSLKSPQQKQNFRNAINTFQGMGYLQ